METPTNGDTHQYPKVPTVGLHLQLCTGAKPGSIDMEDCLMQRVLQAAHSGAYDMAGTACIHACIFSVTAHIVQKI